MQYKKKEVNAHIFMHAAGKHLPMFYVNKRQRKILRAAIAIYSAEANPFLCAAIRAVYYSMDYTDEEITALQQLIGCKAHGSLYCVVISSLQKELESEQWRDYANCYKTNQVLKWRLRKLWVTKLCAYSCTQERRERTKKRLEEMIHNESA